jgi:hypothetical protein
LTLAATRSNDQSTKVERQIVMDTMKRQMLLESGLGENHPRVKALSWLNVTINGEVNQPRLVPCFPWMTVADVLASAAGFTDFAAPKKSRLIKAGRQFQDGQPWEEVDLTDPQVIQRIVTPGDKIIVLHT